ncbi:hypothetical protein BaRGS_00013582 [Batillaria attramentaria]|uniref:Uncharacterized protein n=1 Tax=Batillaria attramentaria TaxID=370345 RepID=A0ABD0L734_9CAEN
MVLSVNVQFERFTNLTPSILSRFTNLTPSILSRFTNLHARLLFSLETTCTPSILSRDNNAPSSVRTGYTLSKNDCYKVKVNVGSHAREQDVAVSCDKWVLSNLKTK